MIIIGRKIFCASSSGILVASSPISGPSVLIETAGALVSTDDGGAGSVLEVATVVVVDAEDSVFVDAVVAGFEVVPGAEVLVVVVAVVVVVPVFVVLAMVEEVLMVVVVSAFMSSKIKLVD